MPRGQALGLSMVFMVAACADPTTAAADTTLLEIRRGDGDGGGETRRGNGSADPERRDGTLGAVSVEEVSARQRDMRAGRDAGSGQRLRAEQRDAPIHWRVGRRKCPGGRRPSHLVSNRVGQSLQRKENRPAPIGSGNRAGEKEDQCARLQRATGNERRSRGPGSVARASLDAPHSPDTLA